MIITSQSVKLRKIGRRAEFSRVETFFYVFAFNINDVGFACVYRIGFFRVNFKTDALKIFQAKFDN